MLVTAIALLVAAAAVFFFSPVVLSCGNWPSRRPSLALNACLAALIGGLLLSAAAVTAIALLVAAAAVFCCSPVVRSCGNWQSRRPSVALQAWLAALSGGLLLSAAAVIALSAGALDAESTGAGSQALASWIAAWVALSAAGIVLALVLSASDDFGRRLKAEAQVLRSRWTDWYIDAPFR